MKHFEVEKDKNCSYSKL